MDNKPTKIFKDKDQILSLLEPHDPKENVMGRI